MRQPGMMELAAPPLPTRASDAGAGGIRKATTEWYFVVIGSFAETRNAAARAAQFRGMGPDILSADIDGQHYSRVVVGPFRSEDREAAVKAAERYGLDLVYIPGDADNHAEFAKMLVDSLNIAVADCVNGLKSTRLTYVWVVCWDRAVRVYAIYLPGRLIELLDVVIQADVANREIQIPGLVE